jgi:hypothetical protein
MGYKSAAHSLGMSCAAAELVNSPERGCCGFEADTRHALQLGLEGNVGESAAYQA